MKIRASGRLALMVATGLTGFCVYFAGPLPAYAAGSDPAAAKSDNASTDKSADQSSRHGRRHARHQSSKTTDKTADKSESKKATNGAGSVTSAGMPATVANANAELTSGDGNASTAPASVNPVMAASDKPGDAQPDGSVVASDQLNDLDRALQQEQPAEQPQPVQPQTAQQEAPPTQPPPAAVPAPKPAPVLASSDSANWDQTSLIGKIFIGFGALLTVASAARMFMA
ncbi:DNA polymerase III gamma/tau subunit [Bradyrhizobium sp. USDA 3240]